MLLKVVSINKDGNTDVPVSCVCFHPIVEKRIVEMIGPLTGELAPMYCAVEYIYGDDLEQVYKALGWQGGTIHQIIAEINRLKDIEGGK